MSWVDRCFLRPGNSRTADYARSGRCGTVSQVSRLPGISGVQRGMHRYQFLSVKCAYTPAVILATTLHTGLASRVLNLARGSVHVISMNWSNATARGS